MTRRLPLPLLLLWLPAEVQEASFLQFIRAEMMSQDQSPTHTHTHIAAPTHWHVPLHHPSLFIVPLALVLTCQPGITWVSEVLTHTQSWGGGGGSWPRPLRQVMRWQDESGWVYRMKSLKFDGWSELLLIFLWFCLLNICGQIQKRHFINIFKSIKLRGKTLIKFSSELSSISSFKTDYIIL